HYWIIESLNDGFTVTAYAKGLSAIASDEITIPTVDMTKTLLIGSNAIASTSCDTGVVYSKCWLKDSTTIRIERTDAANYLVWYCHVVEFQSNVNVNIQRGEFSYGAADSQKQFDIVDVDPERSMVYCPMRGCGKTNGSWESHTGGYHRLQLIGSGGNIQGNRSTDGSQSVEARWQVIEFLPLPTPEIVSFSGGIKLSNVIIK
ncbi:unnamed protein product, partial [marine sediment metagenome]